MPVENDPFIISPEEIRRLNRENRGYLEFLERESSNIVPEIIRDGKINILDIGCGMGEIAGVLNGYFSKFSKPRYFGIDKDEDMIERAAVYHTNNQTNSRFILGNAAEEVSYSEIPETIDVLVSRHPQPTGKYEKEWQKMLSLALTRLEEKGVVIVTAFEKDEINKMEEILLSESLYIRSKGKNHKKEFFDYADRFFLIAAKK